MKVAETLAWNLYAELRKKLVATQQLRARATEFKITFVSAAIGLIVANRAAIGEDRLLILPAFAAVFFDFLIASFSFSIKRQGNYLRDTVEPRLRTDGEWPEGKPLWEEHVSRPEHRQMFSVIANIGITVISALPGAFALLREPYRETGALLLAMLAVLVLYVLVIYWRLGYFAMLREA